jgi:hypothetical protein
MIETLIPGIKAQEAVISPTCRANRGVEGAIDEALRRIKDEYMALQILVNVDAKFHVVLTVERHKE